MQSDDHVREPGVHTPRRETSGETHPVNTVILAFRPPELRDNKCLSFKPPRLFILCGAPANEHNETHSVHRKSPSSKLTEHIAPYLDYRLLGSLSFQNLSLSPRLWPEGPFLSLDFQRPTCLKLYHLFARRPCVWGANMMMDSFSLKASARAHPLLALLLRSRATNSSSRCFFCPARCNDGENHARKQVSAEILQRESSVCKHQGSVPRMERKRLRVHAIAGGRAGSEGLGPAAAIDEEGFPRSVSYQSGCG